MMNIKVLGPGCAKCHALEDAVKAVVKELQLDAQVEKVKDMKQILAYNILMTPGLVINEKVVAAARIPNAAEIKGWLNEAVQTS